MKNIEVSICIPTYNQEKYIGQAIEGALAQKNINFEIIIANDGSTDSSAAICESYRSKYSNTIRIINQERNKGLVNNTRDCLLAARGKYIAICEGDDWWIDEMKLYKQVQILENEAEVSAVHTNWINYNQKLEEMSHRNPPTKNLIPEKQQGVESMMIIMNGDYRGIRFSSLCFRKNLIYKALDEGIDIFNNEYPTLDIVIFYISALYGKYRYINEETTIYRIQEESVSITANHSKRLNYSLGCMIIKENFIRKFATNHKAKNKLLRKSIGDLLSQSFDLRNREVAKKVLHICKVLNYKLSLRQKLIYWCTIHSLLYYPAKIALSFIIKIKD